jgi:hypothetical protein
MIEKSPTYTIEPLENGYVCLKLTCMVAIFEYGVEIHVYTINQKGHWHSIGDTPAHTAYIIPISGLNQFCAKNSSYPTLSIREIEYCKIDKNHRSGNKVARMYYEQDELDYVDEYYVNGKLHRTNGPSRETKSSNDIRGFYLNGAEQTEGYMIIKNFMDGNKVNLNR